MTLELNATEHALLSHLLAGPASYAEMATAAGVKPEGARKAMYRRMLRLRPVIVTYAEDGPFRLTRLELTELGRKSVPTATIVERRGRHRVLDDKAIQRTLHMGLGRAARVLGVSENTVLRARRALATAQ